MRDFYFRRDGTPFEDAREWGAYFEHADRRVAYTKIIDGSDPEMWWDVSTVYVGMDQGWGMTVLPLIFETMAFNTLGEDELCERWWSEESASEGHTRMVVELCSHMTDPIVMEADHPTDRPIGDCICEGPE